MSEFGTGSHMQLAKRALVVTATASAFVVSLILLYWLREAVILTFAGVLLALLLCGLSNGLAHITRLPRGASLIIVGVGIILTVVGLIWWLGPHTARQVEQMMDRVPAAVSELERTVKEWGWGRLPSLKSMLDSSTGMLVPTLGVLRGATGAIAAAVVLLFLGIYLSVQPQKYLDLVLRLAPISKRQRLGDVLVEAGTTLQRWLAARAVCMVEVGLLTIGGLMLLGIDLAIVLGILAGLLTFVPYFGPIIAAVPAILVGFLDSPTTALWVLLLYLGIQAVDNYVVEPLLMQRSVSMPAAIGIMSQIAMGLLFGPIGVIVAAPFVVATGVFLQRLYVEDLLGDSPDTSVT